MEKFLLFILILIIACFTGGTIHNDNEDSKSVIGAIEKQNHKIINVVDVRDIKNGEIVVFANDNITKNGFTLYSAFVKKTLTGWKCEWLGGHGGSTQISSGYFKYDGSGINTGYIVDDKISKIDVKIDDKTVNPKLVKNNDVRFWFLPIDYNIKSLVVVGKNVKGEEVRQIDLTNNID